jgi:ribosomal protein S18 acetylase RimI-like enzyme
MTIHWKIERFDEDEEQDPALASDCALRIEGRIEVNGRPAGQFLAWYLSANDLESPRAFIELWDLDGETCDVYEEIINPERTNFREPLATMQQDAPGVLVIDFIALRPAFRRMGLGLKVMREIVRCCANQWISAVLLDARPLQRRPGGYDHFDEEVRDLPWNEGEEDLARLMNHFRGWGMQRLPRTRFMVCVPDMIIGERAEEWPPVPIANDLRDDDDLPF